MASLQDDLDAIAARQGKNIPPGNVIAGGDKGWPSTPSYDAALPGERFAAPHDDFEDDSEADERPELVSPLIPRRTATLVERPEPDPEILENFRAPDLTILGNDDAAYVAAYQGKQVELSKVEAASVRKVVLTAIVRVIKSQLDEAAALLPKRKRKRADAAESPAPRKRGRPRKVTV